MDDQQITAEALDEEARGEDEPMLEPEVGDGYVHGVIGAPDQLGADDVAELVGTEYPTEDQLSPEEAALHVERERG